MSTLFEKTTRSSAYLPIGARIVDRHGNERRVEGFDDDAGAYVCRELNGREVRILLDAAATDQAVLDPSSPVRVTGHDDGPFDSVE